MSLSLTQLEYLRHAVLAYLAARFPLSFAPHAILLHLRNRQMIDFEAAESDVQASCEMLAGMPVPLASKTPDALGSTPYYSATSSGVLAWERSRGRA